MDQNCSNLETYVLDVLNLESVIGFRVFSDLKEDMVFVCRYSLEKIPC